QQIAQAAGAELLRGGRAERGPERTVIDSRDSGPGALFVGLPGSQIDGGSFAADALRAGAWGVLVARAHGDEISAAAAAAAMPDAEPAVLVAPDPLAALHALATAWRHELGAKVIGVTGSTGKTSTKDLLQALLAPARRSVASRANLNTEIGLP